MSGQLIAYGKASITTYGCTLANPQPPADIFTTLINPPSHTDAEVEMKRFYAPLGAGPALRRSFQYGQRRHGSRRKVHISAAWYDILSETFPPVSRVYIVETGDNVQQSDQELARLHLQGDKHAFCDLVDRYTRSVYNLAYRYTSDRMEAENIAQETFLRVYQALPTTRIDLPLKPWILRITANLCRDWARKKHPSLFSELSSGEEGRPPLIEKLTDDAPLPLDQMEAKEMAEWVRRAVMELPEPYRVVITLRYTEGLSYQEIATILDLPLNTVRTHLFRSKKLLGRALERWLEGEP